MPSNARTRKKKGAWPKGERCTYGRHNQTQHSLFLFSFCGTCGMGISRLNDDGNHDVSFPATATGAAPVVHIRAGGAQIVIGECL